MRLDVALVEKNLVQSREKAKAIIMSGQVYINNQKADKAGVEINDTDQIEIRGEGLRYVSRGGLKLEKAMSCFPITLTNTVCMDIGASTGGFTDCMLQNGADKVYSIDVGYGQLAWSLRNNPKVVNLERTNFRYVTHEQIPEKIDFASVDVSFISLTLILPVAYNLLKDDGMMVCLIKPQFEAGKGKVGKKGVVREPEIHFEVIKKITEFVSENGFDIIGLDFSPIKGPEGNIEYLICLKKSDNTTVISDDFINNLVEKSHASL
ncbi:MAG: TlyA family RNA methyltransferase [Oscillospiraceae bacterium]|nr:TlyA family RNA methyltransferase [Oscillospiraceae bacterium]